MSDKIASVVACNMRQLSETVEHTLKVACETSIRENAIVFVLIADLLVDHRITRYEIRPEAARSLLRHLSEKGTDPSSA